MTTILPDGLLYPQEHITCKNYKVETDTGFKYMEFPAGYRLPLQKTLFHHIALLLEGKCVITYDLYSNRLLEAGRMIFVPRDALFHATVLKPIKLLVFSFNRIHNPCDTRMMESYYCQYGKIDYNFTSVPIKTPLSDFARLMAFYLKSGMNCIHLQEIKHKELFLCIRCFYTKEEVVQLFYPIMGRSLDFRELILQNSYEATCVEDLIRISNMGRTAFYGHFQKEFNMSPKQWILKQIRRKLIMKFSEPNMTVKELISLFNFESPSSFTRFCIREFSSTPLELLAKYQ